MAIQQAPQAEEFRRTLREVLQRETLNGSAINIPAMQTSTPAATRHITAIGSSRFAMGGVVKKI
jgi:hypothetical protein